MKKVGLVLFMSILVLGVSACGSNKVDYEGIMKEYATSYYTAHMIDVDEDEAMISIANLESANELGLDEQYDLTKLSKCTSESSVTLKLNKDTKEVESYEFNMQCN